VSAYVGLIQNLKDLHLMTLAPPCRCSACRPGLSCGVGSLPYWARRSLSLYALRGVSGCFSPHVSSYSLLGVQRRVCQLNKPAYPPFPRCCATKRRGLFCGPFLRKGGVSAYVGSIQTLKDLKLKCALAWAVAIPFSRFLLRSFCTEPLLAGPLGPWV
jgi:hypothetical protein